MVPGKLFIMDGFQDGAPCPGIKSNASFAWRTNYLTPSSSSLSHRDHREKSFLTSVSSVANLFRKGTGKTSSMFVIIIIINSKSWTFFVICVI